MSERRDDQIYEFHRYVMEYLQDAIRLADAKVSLLLVILGASLPALIDKWQDALVVGRWHHVLLLAAASAAYAASMALSIAVFKPRLPTTVDRGLIFFLDILGHADVESYLAAAREADADALLESVLRQNWALAGIVTGKFRYTAWAINASICWLGFAVACVLWIPKA